MSYYNQGLHLCRVTEQGWGETKKEPKRPMVVLKVQVLAEIKKDQEGNEYFEDVAPSDYDQTVYTLIDAGNEQVMDLALKKLRYAGFDGDSFADLDLVNSEVRCINEHRQHEGKVYDGFSLALPPLEQTPLQPLDKAAARKLDALFGRALKEGAAPKEAPPISETIPPSTNDDDIPF